LFGNAFGTVGEFVSILFRPPNLQIPFWIELASLVVESMRDLVPYDSADGTVVQSAGGNQQKTVLDRRLLPHGGRWDSVAARRVELIRGELVNMTAIGPRHGAVVDRTAQTITRLMGDAVIVRAQGTVQLDRFSAPQPDIAVLRKRDDFLRGPKPRSCRHSSDRRGRRVFPRI
jgi:putative restriction endonuclease